MITKELLEQISSLHEELKDLRKRASKQQENIVKDSVRGSSANYPYTEHSIVVEGIRQPKNTYYKQIRSKEYKLSKLINKLEYELNYIEDKDSEIRRIIRYRYEDGLNWVQIMFEMKYNAESVARMKLERFLEKK